GSQRRELRDRPAAAAADVQHGISRPYVHMTEAPVGDPGMPSVHRPEDEAAEPAVRPAALVYEADCDRDAGTGAPGRVRGHWEIASRTPRNEAASAGSAAMAAASSLRPSIGSVAEAPGMRRVDMVRSVSAREAYACVARGDAFSSAIGLCTISGALTSQSSA